MSRIVVIQGHPDPSPERFCRALGEAYAAGAREGGHNVEIVDVAALDVSPARLRVGQHLDDARRVRAEPLPFAPIVSGWVPSSLDSRTRT